MRQNGRFSGIQFLVGIVAAVLIFAAFGSTAKAQRPLAEDGDVFKPQRQEQQAGTPITSQTRGIGNTRLMPGANAPGNVRSDAAQAPSSVLASPVTNCVLNPGPQPASGFTCNVFETDASGTPSEIGNVVALPNPVVGGYAVFKEDGAIADSVVSNWSDVLKFGDGSNSTTSTMQLFSKGCNTGNINDTSCFPAYSPGTSGFVVETKPPPTVYFSAPNTYNVFSAEDTAPTRALTIAGSTGQHDEDSAGIVRYNSFGVNIANGQTGSVHIRYNLAAVEGLSSLCPATLTTIRTRFRNSVNNGSTARLTYEIHTSSITAGGNSIIYTFDSNGRGSGSGFKTATEFVPIDFNFSTNMYWIEATIFRSISSEFSDLGSIQMWESAGTACP
jgi:hypothetical protein